VADLSHTILLWCAFSLLTAGVIKGILGIGIPVVSVSMLSLAINVPMAVSLLPVPILVANLWQSLTSAYALPSLRRFWPLIAGLAVGTFLGARLLAGVDQRVLVGVVGVAVMLFSITGQFPLTLRIRPSRERWLGALVGLVGGVLGGMTTMFGPPIVMFLFALRLTKDEFVGCVATLYLCAAVPLVAALAWFGIMGATEFLWSGIATLPLFAGVLIGQWLRTRVSQDAFRRGLLVVLFLVGLRLVLRAFV
jgi:uncharacterized membrane protein YfcA